MKKKKYAPVPSSPKAKHKMGKVMHEFKNRSLRSSSGEKVTDRKQAIAIAISEARRAGKRK